ncbi:type II restriction endonuclease [Bifidobacterium tissieri]|nr:type II restriction endonuclease [Bifidobacterium tissieri]
MSSYGMLGDYIEKIASKELQPVDVDPKRSNQHEIGGVTKAMLPVLGDIDRKATEGSGIPTVAIYLSDDDDPVAEDIVTSWYDTRRSNPTRSAEWRLYYQACTPMKLASAGDTLYCGYMKDGRLLLAITAASSSVDAQMRWLFGIKDLDGRFNVYDRTQASVDVFAVQLLSLLGFEPQQKDELLLEDMLNRWNYSFPTGREFAQYAEDSLTDIDPEVDDPDDVVLAYYEREYHLFRVLEEAVVQHEYEETPFVSVDGKINVPQFTTFYKHVRNRRMSRAGTSLEQHVQRILEARGIRYAPQAVTEKKKKPDFLFPGVEEYASKHYPARFLRMLAAKTSTKDRWRQVLDEADRINEKHLLTITPSGISVEQNRQMVDKKLRLVMPKKIRDTHPAEVQGNTILFSDFIKRVSEIPTLADLGLGD